MATPSPSNENVRGHIPRPPNAFFIFRSDMVKMVCHLPPNAPAVSKILGPAWRNAPEEIRTYYTNLAEVVKADHLAMNPGYVYHPRTKEEKAEEKKARKRIRNSGEEQQVAGTWAPPSVTQHSGAPPPAEAFILSTYASQISLQITANAIPHSWQLNANSEASEAQIAPAPSTAEQNAMPSVAGWDYEQVFGQHDKSFFDDLSPTAFQIPAASTSSSEALSMAPDWPYSAGEVQSAPMPSTIEQNTIPSAMQWNFDPAFGADDGPFFNDLPAHTRSRMEQRSVRGTRSHLTDPPSNPVDVSAVSYPREVSQIPRTDFEQWLISFEFLPLPVPSPGMESHWDTLANPPPPPSAVFNAPSSSSLADALGDFEYPARFNVGVPAGSSPTPSAAPQTSTPPATAVDAGTGSEQEIEPLPPAWCPSPSLSWF